MGGEKYSQEEPIHKVKLDSFYIGKYPVTQAEWKAIMGKRPSYFQGDNRPVENVSWHDCQKFITELNRQTDKAYRLPTEAEWEYAARGGQHSQGFIYAGSNKLNEVGWYIGNSDGETKEVGLLQSNELGLYEMSGNVWEWCEDDWHDDYHGAPNDGSSWIDTPKRWSDRVLRGGSWISNPEDCRVAARGWDDPGSAGSDIGFRLVLPSSLVEKSSNLPVS